VSAIQEILSNETEKRQEEVWLALADVVNRQYTDSKSGGHLRFDNEIIFVVAEQKQEEGWI
jgi:hypothetical protein